MGEFNSQQENRMFHFERIEGYFIAHIIKSAQKKKAILLSVTGAETYVTAHTKVSNSREAKRRDFK